MSETALPDIIDFVRCMVKNCDARENALQEALPRWVGRAEHAEVEVALKAEVERWKMGCDKAATAFLNTVQEEKP
jgi:tRNA G26 N,N-dimethylase Trm1